MIRRFFVFVVIQNAVKNLCFERRVYIMNSSGWLRSIIAVNMDAEKYLIHVADTIGREFEKEVLVMEIMKDDYMVSFGEYTTIISKDMVEKLKMDFDPYKVDKYILNDFRIQGHKFDKRRSGYIRNVFGVFD